MKTIRMKKEIVVSIIFLFISVSVVPSINFNTVKASTDDDLVEVTTQACGIQGYGNTTVKLTREQYQNLEEYLVEFRARLNQTSTRGEAVPIFKDAVVELYKYGLLGSLSIEQAFHLVTFFNGNTVDKSIKGTNNLLEDRNVFCLISGETQNTMFHGPILSTTLKVVDFLSPFGRFERIFSVILSTIAFYIFPLILLIDDNLFPVQLYSTIYLGADVRTTYGGPNIDVMNQYSEIEPAKGTVWTSGALGTKQWNGSLIGLLRYPYFEAYSSGGVGEDNYAIYFPAVNGFIGIRIFILDGFRSHYFGSAVNVKISNYL